MPSTAASGRDQSVKLSDVARHAGVSAMTVSRVINGEASVRESTKERVLESISALNYRPNLSARALAGNRAYRVALLYGNPSAFYLSQLLVGALEEISQHGHQLLVQKVSESGSHEKVREGLAGLAGAYDGVIVPPPLSDFPQVREFLVEQDMPAVYLSGLTGGGRSRRISVDDFAAAKEMTSYLLGLGHRRIGFIKGNPNQFATKERLRGYKAALADHSVPYDAKLVAPGAFTYASGLKAAGKILSGDPPTAIFASNDDMAAAALAVASSRGLKVPQDISIAGFDDSPLASAVFPRLTTVRQPLDTMAAQAVNTLIDLIRKPNTSAAEKARGLEIPYKMIIGESVAPTKL